MKRFRFLYSKKIELAAKNCPGDLNTYMLN